MKTTKLLIMSAVICLAAFVSCKKDDNTTPSTSGTSTYGTTTSGSTTNGSTTNGTSGTTTGSKGFGKQPVDTISVK